MNGEVVKVLLKKYLTSGEYSVIWDGRSEEGSMVPAGMYFCKLQAGNYTNVKKIIFVK